MRTVAIVVVLCLAACGAAPSIPGERVRLRRCHAAHEQWTEHVEQTDVPSSGPARRTESTIHREVLEVLPEGTHCAESYVIREWRDPTAQWVDGREVERSARTALRDALRWTLRIDARAQVIEAEAAGGDESDAQARESEARNRRRAIMPLPEGLVAVGEVWRGSYALEERGEGGSPLALRVAYTQRLESLTDDTAELSVHAELLLPRTAMSGGGSMRADGRLDGTQSVSRATGVVVREEIATVLRTEVQPSASEPVSVFELRSTTRSEVTWLDANVSGATP